MFEFEEAIEQYAQELEDFIDKYELPRKWFKQADHVAIKCADGIDYEYKIQDLLADAQQATEVSMDDRRLAALNLTSSQSVGNVGNISWVEIMEPRPEKQGKDLVGIDHMEFYYPDFDEVRQHLTLNNVAFNVRTNPGHAWINIVLNKQGQELKINNRLLSDVVLEELESGKAHLL